jgi:hypothetical protein
VNIDFFAAYEAVAVLAGFETAKSALDFPELTLTIPGCFLGYKLCLHRICTRKTV